MAVTLKKGFQPTSLITHCSQQAITGQHCSQRQRSLLLPNDQSQITTVPKDQSPVTSHHSQKAKTDQQCLSNQPTVLWFKLSLVMFASNKSKLFLSCFLCLVPSNSSLLLLLVSFLDRNCSVRLPWLNMTWSVFMWSSSCVDMQTKMTIQ